VAVKHLISLLGEVRENGDKGNLERGFPGEGNDWEASREVCALRWSRYPTPLMRHVAPQMHLGAIEAVHTREELA
jgi:hypothetical protein